MKSILLAATLLVGAFARAQSDTMIEINGEKVSRADYVRRMEYLPGIGKASRDGNFIEVFPGLATVDFIINERLTLQIAKERGVEPTPAEIDAELAMIQRREPGLLDRFTSTGRTKEEYRSVVRLNLANFKLQTEGVLVTDTEIKNLYDLAKDVRFTRPPMVRLRVIAVNAESESKEVDAELKAGKTFAATAALLSKDVTSRVGGMYGDIPLDQLSSNVKDAVTKLKKGDTTAWLKSSDTLLVKFFVEEVFARVTRPLDADLKEDLRRELLVRKGSAKNDVSKLLKEARQKADIKIASPEFEKAYKESILDKKPG
ncbi:MAG: peptidyl-prolyl cis-trans isomerase [Fimbriimonas sp.]|jgi:parvulin-like peptidyl-prolyl isomerase|nr:peptidyl-prolyl cis-trans isomerase [Fimbriimonas sp.]